MPVRQMLHGQPPHRPSSVAFRSGTARARGMTARSGPRPDRGSRSCDRHAPPVCGSSHSAGDPPVPAETPVRRHGARGRRRQHEDARPAEIRMGDPGDRRWLLVDARRRDLRALAFCAANAGIWLLMWAKPQIFAFLFLGEGQACRCHDCPKRQRDYRQKSQCLDPVAGRCRGVQVGQTAVIVRGTRSDAKRHRSPASSSTMNSLRSLRAIDHLPDVYVLRAEPCFAIVQVEFP